MEDDESMNASIYSLDGMEITVGLQSTIVCDEAIQAARRIAEDRGEAVILEDEGDESATRVHPDGSTEDATGWCD